MANINQEIEKLVAEMWEVGKQAAPCKGGNHNNLLRYNELRERILSKFLEAFDAGGRLAMPTLTQPNEPLTLEELREMDEEPVYVVPKDKPAHCGGWCGVTVWKCDRYSYVSLLRDADSGWGFEKYGKTWIAYRRPPEGDGKPTEPPNV